MKKETIYLIVAFVLTIMILGGAYFYFFKKPLTIPQKPTITFPKITTTTITTTTTTSPKIMQSFTRTDIEAIVPNETTLTPPTDKLGTISKFKVRRLQAEDFIAEDILVYKSGVEPKAKLYMPYDGYVMYGVKEGDYKVELAIYTNDNKKFISIFGPLTILCKVTKTGSTQSTVRSYYCENIKKGQVIAEVSENLTKINEDIAFQINGYVDYKTNINFLYESLPLVFK
jgi:hypothetical protein